VSRSRRPRLEAISGRPGADAGKGRPTSSRRGRAAEARAAVARQRRWRYAVLALGAAVVAAVAVIGSVGGGGGGTGSTSPTAFDLPRLDGEGRVRLADFRGKPVVANFFASWCTACEFELPGFTKAAESLKGQVAFIGVNSEETGNGKAMAQRFHLAESGFVLARDIGGTVGSGLHDALRGQGMPITAFYDADGRLVDVARGALPEDALWDRLHQLYGVGSAT
jgi:thiol-disulfide isomerase/thioredoxin